MSNQADVILIIEFDEDGLPFSATIKCADNRAYHYDIEYCKRDDSLYADLSGNGIYIEYHQNKYWSADGISVHCYNEKGEWVLAPPENRVKLPKQYRSELWEWAIEADTVGCSTCGDSFPEHDLCQHVWWDNESGLWSTPDDRASRDVQPN